MTFYFFCQKLESVGLSEIVLESFRAVEIVTTDYFYTKTCKRETPRDKSTIEGLQIELENIIDGGFRPIS